MFSVTNRVEEYNSELPKFPIPEADAMAKAGCFLLPLAGNDGKAPFFKGWNKKSRPRTSLNTLIDLAAKKSSFTYGIRLDGICVVDCDTRSPETMQIVRERFPESAYVVETPRGWHFYFRLANKLECFTYKIEINGVEIDVKAGHKNQVVGAGSIRPDGQSYRWQSMPFSKISELPVFADNSKSSPRDLEPKEAKPKTNILRFDGQEFQMPLGVRNKLLCEKAVEYANGDSSHEELLQNLIATRNIQCEDPMSVSDTEIGKIADWAWGLRLQNKIYAGRKSEFRLARNAMDICLAQRGGSNALLLYLFIVEQHGHKPNFLFLLCMAAMAKQIPNFPLSKNSAYAARNLLTSLGLIICVKKEVKVGRYTVEPAQYRLANALAL